ncbi:MAG: hypothetical protein CVU79_01705 [Elusimicrobia bacterium HGW-Elusimicrobia-3]|nr:MAG: hypothetical protein CVU79_01705 [Elusimicrobia bacterium HGW-Elusimicrobia-3]
MMISLFGYAALLLLISAAALFVLDRLIKMGSRGGDADVTLNGIFYTGLTLTLVFVTVTVIAFTGAFALLGYFLLALAAVLAAAFFWRVRRLAADRALMGEIIAQEERVVRETARRDPGNAAAWTRLAELSDKKGDTRRAVEYMRKACEIEPTHMNSRKLKSLEQSAAAPARDL